MKHLFALLSITFALACASSAETKRILFIGNSLTYWNDLPATVCRDARRLGHRVQCDVVAFPDHDLGDHLQRGDALRQLGRHRYDFVVLQQGPSAAPSSRERLIESCRRFAAPIAKSGARPAVFAAWPHRSRSQDSARAAESARLAAETIGGIVLPVADAWRPELYAADGLHPSAAGTRVASEVIVRALFP